MEQVKVYDARGNGDGKTANAIVGGHECSISDYTSIVLVPFCRSARPKFKGDAETWIPAKVANTLNTFDQGETRANEIVVRAYSFDSLASNSMKSNNPHSGCREVVVAKTLDTTSPDPSKNQGGIAVVICLQGNGIDRADTAKENGKGWNDAGVCYTLNTIDRPAVAYLASGKEKTGKS